MKTQIKFLIFTVIAIVFYTYSCTPAPLPPCSRDWMTIKYLDSKGNFLIDTGGNHGIIKYNDIVIRRVLPDGTIHKFTGDSLPLIFLKNLPGFHPTACILVTNGWLSKPNAYMYEKKVNGDYNGNCSKVTTYIKLSDTLPIDTITVEVAHRHKRYNALKSVHGYTKVYLNGKLVHERTMADMFEDRKVCHLTITK